MTAQSDISLRERAEITILIGGLMTLDPREVIDLLDIMEQYDAIVTELEPRRDDVGLLRVAAEATPTATHATVLRARLLRVLDALDRVMPEERA